LELKKLTIRNWFYSIADNRRRKIYQKDLKVFLELLSPKKSDIILDVGAGLGTIASILAKESSDEVFALEPEETKVEYIKLKHPEVKAFSATASQIPFPQDYFDKLYVTMAFHHFSNQGDALEEFRRVIKKGGLLLIQEINPKEGNGRRLHFFETKILRNNANFLTSQELKNLVVSYGFKAIDERNASRGYLLLAQNEKPAEKERIGWISESYQPPF
jgi:ubiquinone/menaquinone biosynthesis C-methylase UbiE